jgi:uncharacterized cupredoxin-like copper-binding protein
MGFKIVLSAAALFALAACAAAPANTPAAIVTPSGTAAQADATTSTTAMAATESPASAAMPAPTEVITVSMNDFRFVFTPTQITAGTVKFVVHNDSTSSVHEFFLVKTDLPADKLPLKADGTSVDEDSNQFTKLGSVEDVDPGKGGEMTVKLDPGHYVYFCNTTGHYKLGMAGEVAVPSQGMASLMPSMSMSASAGTNATQVASLTQVVTVSMTNFAFKFTPSTVKAGTVRFLVKNDSTDQMHEFFLVKTDLPVNKLPMTSDGTMINEESNQFMKLGSVEDVDAGKSGEMTVKLEPGRYVYFCNKQGHYKLGMAGEMMVAP